MIRLCVVGAAGRMGARLLRRLAARSDLELASALVAPSDPRDLGAPLVTTEAAAAFAPADVVIDFSAPAACGKLLPIAAAKPGLAYLVASTGLTEADGRAIDAAARSIAVLQAANLSVGVNVLFEAVELTARRLGAAFDVEIGEIHHKHKKDAPSGTALALGEAVRAGRGATMRSVLGRAGQGPARAADELGFAALRGGDVAGEHTVFFFGEGERLELTHRATTPDIFADGALCAALWLAGKKPGRYRMRDVLAGA